MPTSKSSSDNRRAQSAAQLAGLTDQACHQMAQATEVAALACRHWECVQQVQQQSAQRTSQRLQQAAAHMRQLNNPVELLGVSSNLWSAHMQELAQWMQELTLSTVRLQGTWVRKEEETVMAASRAATGGARSAADTGTPRSDAMGAATDAATAATTAMLQSWSAWMGGPAARH